MPIGVTLAGSSVAPAGLPPGGLLTVHLDWRGEPAQLAGSEKVFVHLLDPSGALVAQDDRPLALTGTQAGGTGLAAYGLWLPSELGPGAYQLVAGIYDPASRAPRGC